LVRLIAVTKGVAADRVLEAVDRGVGEIGENRVQEAVEKKASLAREVRWHMIGHLQRNKAKLAGELFDEIHSVDSLELVRALQRCAVKPLKLLVQVNLAADPGQHGCRPEEARPLAEAILASNRLKLSGLMTLAPWGPDPEAARPFFKRLRLLRDDLQRELGGLPLDLSMGMSHDFEAAVEEGATMVRLGTAIFGAREQ
jgi:pyridoxal phosphate enzyme (YggS family)